VVIFPLLPLAVQVTEVPVSDVNIPFLGYTCIKEGMPMVRVEHGGNRRVVRFAGGSGSSRVIFDLVDALQSMTHERTADGVRWVLRAEGRTESSIGVSNGTQATIVLTAHEPSAGFATGDFVVRAGSFSQEEAGCSQMPQPTAQPGSRQ